MRDLNIYLNPANISTFFQRCLLVDATSWRWTTSNHHWNNVVYFNHGIYNVKQRWINVVYFNVDMNNVRKRWNTLSSSTLIWTALVNVETTLWKWPFLKWTKQIISNWIHGIRSFNYYFILFFTLFPMLIGNKEYLQDVKVL